jgi:hypothetical protein
MSKTHKGSDREYEFISYRLDAIERRLDGIEKATRSHGDSDMVHILLDLLKTERSATQLKASPQAACDTALTACDEAQAVCDVAEPKLDTFTTLLARRRAMT